MKFLFGSKKIKPVVKDLGIKMNKQVAKTVEFGKAGLKARKKREGKRTFFSESRLTKELRKPKKFMV